ncbi:MAG: hypothetical protein FJZ07_02440 [Candidatus Nealsonbacteria bacterium]|nr:hypothetical protein [Candidatus Nealsonbacteria bacterium]
MKKFRFFITLAGIILLIIGLSSNFAKEKLYPCPIEIEGIVFNNCDYFPTLTQTLLSLGVLIGDLGIFLLIIGTIFYIAFYIDKAINKINNKLCKR